MRGFIIQGMVALCACVLAPVVSAQYCGDMTLGMAKTEPIQTVGAVTVTGPDGMTCMPDGSNCRGPGRVRILDNSPSAWLLASCVALDGSWSFFTVQSGGVSFLARPMELDWVPDFMVDAIAWEHGYEGCWRPKNLPVSSPTKAK